MVRDQLGDGRGPVVLRDARQLVGPAEVVDQGCAQEYRPAPAGEQTSQLTKAEKAELRRCARSVPVAEPLTSGHQSSWLPSVALGQKPTCTFVSGAVHTLQRVHRVSNARARGFRHRLNMRCDGPPRDAGAIQVS